MYLWPMLWKIKLEEARELWALVELCLCCPYGNAAWVGPVTLLRIKSVKLRSFNLLRQPDLTTLKYEMNGSQTACLRVVHLVLVCSQIWLPQQVERTQLD
jgi:hypothetical protein